MKVNNMKAVIFDIEGVLIDVSERLKLCLEETGKKFYANLASKISKSTFL